MFFKNILDTDYIELKNEIVRLKEDCSKSNKLLKMESNRVEYLEKNIMDMESYVRELELKIHNLNEELKEYNPNLKPMPKKVTKEKVIEVKNMIAKGLSYRVTSKETDISIKTISRIVNGYYNHL